MHWLSSPLARELSDYCPLFIYWRRKKCSSSSSLLSVWIAYNVFFLKKIIKSACSPFESYEVTFGVPKSFSSLHWARNMTWVIGFEVNQVKKGNNQEGYRRISPCMLNVVNDCRSACVLLAKVPCFLTSRVRCSPAAWIKRNMKIVRNGNFSRGSFWIVLWIVYVRHAARIVLIVIFWALVRVLTS